MKRITILFLTIITSSIVVLAQDDYVLPETEAPVPKTQELKFPNPDFTNYSFSAAAFTLDKGDAQLLGTDILFSKISYGINDRSMISMNASLFGTFTVSFKQRIPVNEEFNLAFSACAGNFLFIDKDSIIRLFGGQSLATFGNHQNNVTFGIGLYFGKSSFEVVDQTKNLFFHHVFVATQRQIRPKTYLVAEGMYYWNYNTFMGSFAMKFVIKSRMSLHVGIMPLYRNGRISRNQTRQERGAVPIISYRWLLH
ncbi:MAG: hypothetical protein KDD41_09495 [Flavobacteriales bacterium]|nr:hypothetical protein [Flavobacteriales bacterium]